MKFKLHQSNFLEALSAVQSVVGSHAIAAGGTSTEPMRILSNVLIEASGEDLTFTTTDLDLTTRYTCKAEIAEEGAITLPVKRLLSIVRVLSNQIVEIASDPKQENVVRMTCGSYRGKFVCLDAKNFPPVVGAEGTAFKLPQAVFKEMLSSALTQIGGTYIGVSHSAPFNTDCFYKFLAVFSWHYLIIHILHNILGNTDGNTLEFYMINIKICHFVFV